MSGLGATTRVATRSARSRLGRIAATLIGAALSASFAAAGFGVAASFETLIGGTNGAGDLEVGLPEGSVVISADTGGTTEPTAITADLVALARDTPGVLTAQGTYDQPIGVEVPNGSQDIRPPILKNLIFSSAFDPARWRIVEGRAPVSGDPEARFLEVALDSGAMAAAFTQIGSVIELESPIGRVNAQVVGQVEPVTSDPSDSAGNDAAPVTTGIDDVRIVADVEDLGWLLGAEGRVDRITVTPEENVATDVLISRLSENLPEGLAYAEASDRAANQTKVVTTITEGISAGTWAFAIVSALVAAVLVANTFSILVAQRMREIGVARTIGMSRSQVVISVLIEASIVGVIAALLGMAGSVPLASWGTRLINPDVVTGTRLSTSMIAAAWLVGFVVTVLAAVMPAMRASRTTPLEGLRVSVDSRRRRNLGWLLTAPLLWAFGPLVSPFRSPRMALASARRDARRSGATASTLSLAFGLVAAVLTLSASIRSTIDDQFIGSSDANVYIQRRGLVRVDTASLVERLGVPEGVGFTTVSSVEATLRRGSETLSNIGATQVSSVSPVFDLEVSDGSLPESGLPEVIVSTQGAEALDAAVGDVVVLRSTSGTESELVVSGIFNNAAFFGDAIVDWDVAESVDAMGTFELGAIVVPDEFSNRQTIRAIRRELGGFHKIRVERPEEFAELNTSVTDTVTRLVLVLLSGSIMLGALGLANTVSLSVLERRRELAVLRSVGAFGSQIRMLITTEAALLSAAGAIVGIALGTAFAVAGVGIVPAQFASEVVIPWTRLAGLFGGAVFIGATSAWLPANAASRRPILDDLSLGE